jgi:protein TonB
VRRRGRLRWQPRGGAIVAPDPRAVLAIAAPPRARIGLGLAVPLSLALHAAGIAWLSARGPAPAATVAPIEVALLREAPPGPIELPPAPAPPPAPRPVAKRPAPAPTPRRVAAVAKPAPVAEVARIAPAATSGATGAGTGTRPAPVAAAPPSGGGGGGGNPLEAYVASVLRRIEAKKRYPSLARSRGVEGTVVVTLWISPAGAIARLEVGGDAPPLLVGSTRDAVEKAGPFPPPPAGLPSIRVPIRYALR